MAKSKDIHIENLGDAVMHLQAVILYMDKHHKKLFRFILVLMTIGFILGMNYWASLKTVSLKELKPLGVMNSPFTLYAGEQFKVENGVILFSGKQIGTIDQEYEIYKFQGKNEIVIHNKRTGRAFTMELELN